MKKILSFTAALTLILSCVSCSESKQESSQTVQPVTVTQTMYKEDRLTIPDDFASCYALLSVDSRLILVYADSENSFKIAQYGDDMTIMNTRSMDVKKNESMYSFLTDSDGNICVLSMTAESELSPEDITDNESFDEYWESAQISFSVKTFNTSGALLSEVALGDLADCFDPGNTFIQTFSLCGDNYIISFGDKSVRVDKEGNVLESAEIEMGGCYISGFDGAIYFCGMRNFARTDSIVKADEPTEYPNGASMNNLPFIGDERFSLYFMLDDGLYGMTAGSELVKIIDYASSNIKSSDIGRICPISEGKYAALEWGGASPTLVLLTVRPDDYVEQRETLIVGIHNEINTSDRDMGTDFSRFNDNYEVEFRKYDYDRDDLKQDILSGDSPDVYVFDNINEIYSYANMGAFADYNELSAEYGGMTSDFFLDNVVDALTYKGKLYAMSDVFYPNLLAANREVIGREDGHWDLPRFIDIVESMPEDMYLSEHYGFDEPWRLFFYLCAQNLDEWVDFDNATCNFDSDEFIRVLEVCRDANYIGQQGADDANYYDDDNERQRAMDAEEDAAMLSKKQSLLYNMSTINNMEHILNSAPGLHGMDIDDMTFLSNPNSDGNGTLNVDKLYAVLNSGNCRQGAWEYVNFVMSYDNQFDPVYTFEFPTGKQAFEDAERLEFNKLNEVGESSGSMNGYSYTYDCHLTEEQFEYITDTIKSCSHYGGWHSDICPVLSEEFEKFIAGETTAEQCADMLQNRISIYLSENS